ncbi:MAG: energy-coupling factor transporter transmembrane protein EcfT [Firmicutes bacterium]|nr:energy-coupling factor transporter transmembrane protein EcfT [Bacillota bacterium]
MLKDITIGQYVPGDSAVHRLDPRTKIIATGLLMMALFILEDKFGLFVLGVLLIGAQVASGLPLRMILRGLRPLLIILLIAVPLQLFLTPGQSLLYLGPFTITDQGLRLAGLLIVRLIFLIILTSLLTLTTSPIALTDGLERLLTPLKRIRVPAHELAMMTTIALRFIPIFAEEAEKIIKAQKARGANFEGGGVVQRGKNLVAVLVPLLVSAFRRAEDLALAMEARCYQGGEKRTRLYQPQMTGLDYLVIAVSGLMCVYSILTRVWPGILW